MKKLLFILSLLFSTQVHTMEIVAASTSAAAAVSAALNIITPALHNMRVNPNPTEQPLPAQPAIPAISLGAKADVVLLHGLGSTSYNMGALRKKIEQAFKGTKVHNLTIPIEYRYNLLEQQNWLVHELRKDKYKDVGTIIGQSQGAVLARTAVQHGALPKIASVILSVGPQQGVAGFPGDWDDKDWNAIKDINKWTKFANEAAHVALDIAENHVGPLAVYNTLVKNSSLGALYNPPYHPDAYRKHNPFLPIINNEVEHQHSQTFRNNLNRIAKYFVCLRATDETTLEPPVTAWFGYYKEKDRDTILQAESMPVFSNLGIDQLATRQAFYRLLVSGNHGNLIDSQTNFDQFVAPFIAGKDDLASVQPLERIDVPKPESIKQKCRCSVQ